MRRWLPAAFMLLRSRGTAFTVAVVPHAETGRMLTVAVALTRRAIPNQDSSDANGVLTAVNARPETCRPPDDGRYGISSTRAHFHRRGGHVRVMTLDAGTP